MKTDPFYHWKARWKKTYRQVLTEIELRLLIEKEFKFARLERTRDVFVFCCFTGLAYIDVKNLDEENIHSIGNKKWIRILRTKTKVQSTIPLSPIAEAILEKYRMVPTKQIGQRLLPVLSNQKMN